MSDPHKEWRTDGAEHGWVMPHRWWGRIPVIRHVTCVWLSYQIDRDYQMWGAAGAISTGYDEWCLYGFWNGLTTPVSDRP